MITCPAYFGTAEREATANAGRLAGLNGEPRLVVLEDAGSTWRLTGKWNGRDARAELAPGG